MRYPVNPRIDLAFKRIFGVEENKDLTISLLNSIVDEEDRVEDITLLNPYNPQRFAEDKLSILDIKAKGCNGKLFNIEIQVTDEQDYDKRALYYWAKLYTDQMKRGEDYGVLEKTIGIHILNIPCIWETKKYHNCFRLKEVVEGFVFFKDIELHTVELSKFIQDSPEDLKEFIKKVKDALDVWSTFLTKYDYLDPEALPGKLNVPEIKQALDVLEHINMKEDEREAYESREKWMRIQKSALKKQFLEGKVKGKEEIAKKMLEKGQSVELVSEITGLSKESVEKLHETHTQKSP
jgi:predicted transposase/invertase (TIGR01784 family)